MRGRRPVDHRARGCVHDVVLYLPVLARGRGATPNALYEVEVNLPDQIVRNRSPPPSSHAETNSNARR